MADTAGSACLDQKKLQDLRRTNASAAFRLTYLFIDFYNILQTDTLVTRA